MEYEIDLVEPVDEPIKDMPLNDSDKAWIRQEIREANTRYNESKFKVFFRDWGGLFGVAGLIIFTLVQWSSYVDFRSHTSDRLDALEQKDIPGLSKRLDKIDSNLQDLTSKIETIRLVEYSSNPSDLQNSTQITHLLSNAKAEHVKLDPAVIKNNGSKFISAAQNSPLAWTAALSFLNYHSYLNIDFAPNFPDAKGVDSNEQPAIDLNFRPLPPPPIDSVPRGTSILGISILAHGEGVLPEKAAIIEKISNPKKRGGNFGVYIINAFGGTIVLDDQRMRNVVINNAVIDYKGGRSDLDNVYFVNCIFKLQYTPNGMQLGEDLLASTSTNFKSKS